MDFFVYYNKYVTFVTWGHICPHGHLRGHFRSAHLAPGKVTYNLGFKSVGKLGN